MNTSKYTGGCVTSICCQGSGVPRESKGGKESGDGGRDGRPLVIGQEVKTSR